MDTTASVSPLRLLDDRATRLFVALAAFFCANAVLAEFIGVKIFALEDSLGIAPLEWNLFGQSGSLNFTAGTLLWPIVFIMTDTVNEYFGKRGVRMISWLAAGLIVYSFVFAYLAIHLAPASWWVGAAKDQGVPDYQAAYAAIFGQGMWIIVGSLIAFLVGQLIDVQVFHRIRSRTGERHAWLRATGSTA
ncbi:MAG TPA: queuosine precursor transporter, partial [Thermomonas sp.]|nr:queuosine precursor transporter [Thermomonas sp.]